MYENAVEVAQFYSTEEAFAARIRLEAEDIACTLSEESPSPADFSLLGRMGYAPIRLYVAASQVERAAEILASNVPLELDEDWKAQAENAVEGWICHNCDTPVEESATECPECATPRRIRKKKRK